MAFTREEVRKIVGVPKAKPAKAKAKKVQTKKSSEETEVDFPLRLDVVESSLSSIRSFENLTVAELKVAARKAKVDLKGITRKSDIIKALTGETTEVEKPSSKKSSIPAEPFLEIVTEVNEKRDELFEHFRKTFTKELSVLPKDTSIQDVLSYLSGIYIRVHGKNYKLNESVISEELYRAIYDLCEPKYL